MLCAFFTEVGAKDFTLVIDAGHGGQDAGAVGAISKEKDINLRTALAFGKYVEKNCPDVKVIYTRKKDVFVTLKGRAEIANKAKADADAKASSAEKGKSKADAEYESASQKKAEADAEYGSAKEAHFDANAQASEASAEKITADANYNNAKKAQADADANLNNAKKGNADGTERSDEEY